MEMQLAQRSRTKKWTVEEYCKLIGTGVFEGQRLELVGGEIITMSPMGEAHAVGTDRLSRHFNRKLPDRFVVRNQAPLYIGEDSAPEPDIAIVDAETENTLQRPTTAHLVVEVSRSTLLYDQSTKMSLYASAQIPEYWILNLNARRLEIYREPLQDIWQPFGWRYGSLQTLPETASVSPLVAPQLSFEIRDLLPPEV